MKARIFIGCTALFFGISAHQIALAGLENPSESEIRPLSGITVFSGWKCNPGTITFAVDGGTSYEMASATYRPDTASVCGNSGYNGYGVLYNVNIAGDGQHVARFYDNGAQFAQATFSVVTLGQEYITGLSGSGQIEDFPHSGEGVGLQWVENLQGFQISSHCTGASCPPTVPDPTQWGTCTWETVGGLESHNDLGDWCPDGTFLTQFDLDRFSGASDTDNPVVGRARCCQMSGFTGTSWSSCAWHTVGATESHQQDLLQWCPDGRFLTQFDLDSGGSGADSPYVGRANCCTLAGLEARVWDECHWVQVGALESHNDLGTWCPSGTFLSQFDLDSSGSLDAQDSPYVGHAQCCRLSN